MSKAPSPVSAYNEIGLHSGIEAASPHRLILMLLDGAMDNVAKAKGHLGRGELAAKGEHIGWAMSIIGGLQSSLDLERGGELAVNLDRLYEYLVHQLLQANLHNDPQRLDEVGRLLGQIRSAWSAIAPLNEGATRATGT